MTVRGPLAEGDLDRLCRQVEALLGQGEAVVLRVLACDLTVVDAVARLRLLARRQGAALALEGERDLLSWCGLEG